MIIQQIRCKLCAVLYFFSSFSRCHLLFLNMRKSAESIICSSSRYQRTCKGGVPRRRHSRTTSCPFTALTSWRLLKEHVQYINVFLEEHFMNDSGSCILSYQYVFSTGITKAVMIVHYLYKCRCYPSLLTA